MRLDQLTVRLRARTAWEAEELGIALVRRHAAAIWKPWLLASLPVFALIGALTSWLERPWLAMWLLWWIKPLFDRIPLFVISRATFGQVPGTRQTLAAQLRWGWRPMLGYLTWRRLSPARSLLMPVDLLEGSGAGGPQQRQRRRVLGQPVYLHAGLLTWVCVMFAQALTLACIALIFMFVPVDDLPEAGRAAWTMATEDPPWWAWMIVAAFMWLAETLVEPFYVGAGFGLYLNRRTQIEAWDVEIVFRRMRQRLTASSLSVLLLGALSLGAQAPAQAQARDPAPAVAPQQQAQVGPDEDEEEDEAETGASLQDVFGQDQAGIDDAAFERAAAKAYQDPLLGSQRTVKRWEARDPKEDAASAKPSLPWLAAFGSVIAFLGEWGLWMLAALLVILLLWTAPYWLKWMRGLRQEPVQAAPQRSQAVEPVLPLPPDVATQARALWARGRARDALALLYRASVEAMVLRAGVTLAPGATEAECLRAARRMPEAADRASFAQAVRVWQYAAYAQTLPDDAAFDSLVGDLQQRFGWRA
ncbi:DUF4129 domain-containing protein [Pseudoxanthomonas composti]|uniref:DUF4129 domain-containing protein n=1 Tax=Pseudoxanthomonas composti TaxID=2137479 RepID=A0A4Q1JVZ1_9GAMM|nr:DUF4129 domain-containing protein [Pseudoxanthomonas composti]RXR06441.1 DUF4129 domain-containing protein [Pseudoxanthomonas composti]